MTFPAHVPNDALSLDRIPDPDGPLADILQFAHTFHAYDVLGSFGAVATVANNRRASSLTQARACLFFERRRMVHSPEAGDSAERQAWLRELTRRIRAFVQDRRID